MRKAVVTYMLVFVVCFSFAQRATFTNPLLPAGADPWSIHKDGYYYYTHTVSDSIVIWKTKTLATLKNAERKTVFVPPANTLYSKQLWAPEIHFINNKWYIYFAADDGRNETHRIYLLENSSADPFTGDWKFMGKVSDESDKWAIDASIFTYHKNLYMVWSGWEGDTNGRQDIFIAKMKNPYTVEGKRVRISSPHYDWETYGPLNDSTNPALVTVNEGPQVLEHNGKLFLVYSASGCWTEKYSLGLLTLTGKENLLDSSSWRKSPAPVFETNVESKVYAPGHNSFFKSPDAQEDWILYHANNAPGQGCGRNRSPRAQRFYWKDGTPYFGKPVKTGMVLKAPSQKTERRKS